MAKKLLILEGGRGVGMGSTFNNSTRVSYFQCMVNSHFQTVTKSLANIYRYLTKGKTFLLQTLLTSQYFCSNSRFKRCRALCLYSLEIIKVCFFYFVSLPCFFASSVVYIHVCITQCSFFLPIGGLAFALIDPV